MNRASLLAPASLAALAVLLLALPGCKSKLKKDAVSCSSLTEGLPRAERCLEVCARGAGAADADLACGTVGSDVSTLCYQPWSDAHPSDMFKKPDFKGWLKVQPQCTAFCNKVVAVTAAPDSQIDKARKDCEQMH